MKSKKDLFQEMNQLKLRYKKFEKTFIKYQCLNEKLALAQRDLSLKVPNERDLKKVYSICLDLAIEVSGMDSGGIYAVDDITGDFYLVSQKKLTRGFNTQFFLGHKDSDNTKRIARGNFIYREKNFSGILPDSLIQKEKIKVIAIVPFKYESRVIGCLYVASHTLDKISRKIRKFIEIVAVKITNTLAWVQAEKELKKTQSRNEAYVTANPDIMFLFSKEGVFEDCHYPDSDLLYVSAEQFIGKHVKSVLPEDIATLTLDKIAEAQEKRSLVVYDYRLELKDKPRYFEARMSPCGKDSFLAIVREVTDQKKIEDKFKESETQYRNIFENAIEGIYRSFPDGPFLMVNPTFAKMFGYDSPDEMIRMITDISIQLYADPEDRMSLTKILLEQGRVTGFEIKMRCKKGSTIWVSLSAHTVCDKGGSLLYFEGIAVDISEQKAMELKLKESEQNYRLIFENAMEGIFQTTPNGEIIKVNLALSKMFGFDSPEDMRKMIFNMEEGYINLSDRQRIKKILEQQGQVNGYECEMHCPDENKKLWISINSHLVRDSSGNISYYEGTCQNITAQKRIEEELKKSEEKYRKIVDLVHEGILMFDAGGYITFVNPRMAEMLEYNVEEMTGKNIFVFLDKKEIDAVRIRLENRTQGISECYDLNFLTKTGRIVNTIISATPILDKNGIYSGSISGILDVTIRKSAQESLRESEARFRQIADNVNEAFWIVEVPINKFIYVNKAFEDIFGIPKESLYADIQSLSRLLHPDDLSIFEKIKTLDKTFNTEHRILRPNGEVRWIRSRGFPVKNSQDSVDRMVGVITDITDYKKASEIAEQQRLQLIQADKLMSLGILVAGIAHEINNPNNYISLSISLLRKAWESLMPIIEKHKTELDQVYIGSMPFSEFVQNVNTLFNGLSEGSQRIKRIVSDLKDYARQDSFDLTCNVDINKVVQSSVNLMNSMIQKHTKTFSLELSAREILIKGSAQKIEQVIINLIHNACDALTSNEQSITVSTELREDHHAAIVVSDKGCGISKEDINKITDPFFTTKREKGGSGLGLSVSSGIIKDHGGEMLFASEPGKGTTVTILLPRN